MVQCILGLASHKISQKAFQIYSRLRCPETHFLPVPDVWFLVAEMLIDHPEAKLNVKVLVPPRRLQSRGYNLTPGIVLVNSGTLTTVVSIPSIAKRRLDT
jgi:hypothetical protein